MGGPEYDPTWFPIVLVDDKEEQPSLFIEGVIDLFLGYLPAIRIGLKCIRVLEGKNKFFDSRFRGI